MKKSYFSFLLLFTFSTIYGQNYAYGYYSGLSLYNNVENHLSFSFFQNNPSLTGKDFKKLTVKCDNGSVIVKNNELIITPKKALNVNISFIENGYEVESLFFDVDDKPDFQLIGNYSGKKINYIDTDKIPDSLYLGIGYIDKKLYKILGDGSIYQNLFQKYKWTVRYENSEGGKIAEYEYNSMNIPLDAEKIRHSSYVTISTSTFLRSRVHGMWMNGLYLPILTDPQRQQTQTVSVSKESTSSSPLACFGKTTKIPLTYFKALGIRDFKNLKILADSGKVSLHDDNLLIYPQKKNTFKLQFLKEGKVIYEEIFPVMILPKQILRVKVVNQEINMEDEVVFVLKENIEKIDANTPPRFLNIQSEYLEQSKIFEQHFPIWQNSDGYTVIIKYWQNKLSLGNQEFGVFETNNYLELDLKALRKSTHINIFRIPNSKMPYRDFPVANNISYLSKVAETTGIEVVNTCFSCPIYEENGRIITREGKAVPFVSINKNEKDITIQIPGNKIKVEKMSLCLVEKIIYGIDNVETLPAPKSPVKDESDWQSVKIVNQYPKSDRCRINKGIVTVPLDPSRKKNYDSLYQEAITDIKKQAAGKQADIIFISSLPTKSNKFISATIFGY